MAAADDLRRFQGKRYEALAPARPAPLPSPKPKQKPKRRPKPKAPPKQAADPIARAVRQVGRTTRAAAPTTRRAVRREVAAAGRRAATPQGRADRELDAILDARVKARRVRAKRAGQEDVSAAGITLQAGGFDPETYRRAAAANQGGFMDPVGHFLGPALEKLDAPAYLIGNLIRRPSGEGYLRGTEAIGRSIGVNRIPGVDIGREEDKVLPAQALRERGWMPGGWLGTVADIGANIALNPATYVSFGGAGAGAGTKAAVRLSRALTLKDVARTVPRAQTLARPVGKQVVQATKRGAQRIVASGRLGPDVPAASVRAAKAAAAKAARSGAARRRGLADMPFPASARAGEAVERYTGALAERARASRRYISPSQAARAGARAERGSANVLAAERKLLAKMRGTPGGQRSALIAPRRAPTPKSAPYEDIERFLELKPPSTKPVGFTAKQPAPVKLPSGTKAQPATVTPLQARRLPALRERELSNQRVIERIFEERAPTPRMAEAAGERFQIARQRLAKVRDEVYELTRPPTVVAPKATGEQLMKYREAFTNSKVRKLVDAEMDVTTASEVGRRSSNLGLTMYLPGMAPSGKGVPLFRIPGTAKFRSPKSTSLPGGKAAKVTGFDRVASDWRDLMVSQYGPNRIVGDGALAAENFVNYSRGRIVERIIAKSKGLSRDERILASHYREGTVPASKVPKAVREYADEMGRLTDEMLDEYLKAGGDVRRLRREYVYHAFQSDDADNAIAALTHLKWSSDRYANTPGFARKRAFPTIQQAKDAGLEPVEDLAELTVMRASAHYRALSQMELARSVAKRYGRKLDDIPGITAGMSAAERSQVLKKWVNLNDVVGGQVKGAKDLFVPADVAATLKNAAEIPRRAVARNAFSKGTRRFNRSWKQMALLTSGYHIRNQISDMILVAQSGQEPFSALYRGLGLLGRKARTRTSRPAKGLGRGRSIYTRGEQAELSDILGVSGHGIIAKDVGEDLGATVSRARAIPRGYQRFSSGRENLMRRGSVSGYMDRIGPVMAARHTRRNVYDYGDVGRAVDVARKQPIAPFITWPVKNIPRQAAHLVQRPRSFIAANAINRALWEQGGAPSALPLPDYARERMPTYIPGFGWAAYDNPMADLNMIPGVTTRPVEGVARSYAGMLSPFVQAPFAAATGQSPGTGIEFRDRQPASDLDVALSRIPGLREILAPDVTLQTDTSGKKIPVESVRGLPSWMFSSFIPGASQTNRFGIAEQVAPRTVGEASRGNWIDEFGSQLLGVRRTDPNNLRVLRSAIGKREWDQRELAIEINSKAKARRQAGLPANKREFPEWVRMERLKLEIRELKRLEREAKARSSR